MAAVGTSAYDDLAAVYDWLVPEELLTPEGNVAMFDEQLSELESRASVLDCACGTGMLAVGMALRGFDVSASDGSAAMVERTRRLAAEHGVGIAVAQSTWGELENTWPSPFNAVFCVGNSLTHANDRKAALRAMHGVLGEHGLLVLTSRNWERVRAEATRSEETVERHGIRARVTHAWHMADEWDAPHHMDIAVALPDATYTERLEFWPFTDDALAEDLRAAGFATRSSTYGDEADRYLVTALRTT